MDLRERHKGRKGNDCTCRTVRETDLLAAICVQMKWEHFFAERFQSEVSRVMVEADGLKVVRRNRENFSA